MPSSQTTPAPMNAATGEKSVISLSPPRSPTKMVRQFDHGRADPSKPRTASETHGATGGGAAPNPTMPVIGKDTPPRSIHPNKGAVAAGSARKGTPPTPATVSSLASTPSSVLTPTLTPTQPPPISGRGDSGSTASTVPIGDDGSWCSYGSSSHTSASPFLRRYQDMLAAAAQKRDTAKQSNSESASRRLFDDDAAHTKTDEHQDDRTKRESQGVAAAVAKIDGLTKDADNGKVIAAEPKTGPAPASVHFKEPVEIEQTADAAEQEEVAEHAEKVQKLRKKLTKMAKEYSKLRRKHSDFVKNTRQHVHSIFKTLEQQKQHHESSLDSYRELIRMQDKEIEMLHAKQLELQRQLQRRPMQHSFSVPVQQLQRVQEEQELDGDAAAAAYDNDASQLQVPASSSASTSSSTADRESTVNVVLIKLEPNEIGDARGRHGKSSSRSGRKHHKKTSTTNASGSPSTFETAIEEMNRLRSKQQKDRDLQHSTMSNEERQRQVEQLQEKVREMTAATYDASKNQDGELGQRVEIMKSQVQQERDRIKNLEGLLSSMDTLKKVPLKTP